MKRGQIAVWLFISVLFLGTSLFAEELQKVPAPPKGEEGVSVKGNLLLNPGFEASNEKNESPTHWLLEKSSGYEPDETLDAEYAYGEAHTGKYCVKISTSNSNHSTIISHLHPETGHCFATRGFEKIKISGWMKTEDVVPGKENWMKPAIGFWLFKKNNQEPVGYGGSVFGPKGTTDWTYFEKEFTLPEEANYIRFWIANLHSTGTFWVDDVSLVPVREP